MCLIADKETQITTHYSKELENDTEDTWILSAQSSTQSELLKKHKKEIPIFVEGPHFTWIRSKLVHYFVMKTDPLPEIKQTQQTIESNSDENFSQIYNMFKDPFDKNPANHKRPTLTVHEQLDGVIYAVCCTGTSSKVSAFNWTKFIEMKNPFLKDYVVVYRIKEKRSYAVTVQDKRE